MDATDEELNYTMDAFEAFASSDSDEPEDLSQVGGRIANQASGRFVFHLEPVHVRQSHVFRTTEHVYNVHMTQEGTFHEHQRLADALTHALRSALGRLLNTFRDFGQGSHLHSHVIQPLAKRLCLPRSYGW